MLTFSNTLQRVVQQRAEKIATIDGDRRHSWKEFHRRVSQFAGALQKLGVKQGSRVAILSLNSDRYLEAMFAIPWAGAAYVPINTRLAAPEVEYWMQNSESEVLLVDRNFLPMLDHLRATLPKLKHIIFMDNGEPAEGLPHYEDLLADTEAVDAAPVQPNDLVALYYTGGTTGRSKGVMLSHHNMLFNAMQGMVVQSYSGDEIYLHAAPMFHAADAYNAICFCLLGGTHVFTPGFDPKRVLELIGEEKVTRILLVPTMVGMVMSYPELDDYDLSSLKSIFYGASPMPEAVLKAAMAKYPAMEFMQAYGQTEAAPVLTILMPEDHVPEGERSRLLKSAGKAAPGVTLAILDGQLIRVGEHVYIFPLVSIVESIQSYDQMIHRVSTGCDVLRLRDEYVPIVRLWDIFNIQPDSEKLEDGLLVVVEGDNMKIAVLVDDLLAQQQVVIKSLQDNYRSVEGISGATILGDGTVSLIMDIAGLTKLAGVSKDDYKKVPSSDETEAA